MIDDRTDDTKATEAARDPAAQDDATNTGAAEEIDADDPHKAEKLTKAGRDIDPDDSAE